MRCRRLLSALLVAVMLLTSLPLSAISALAATGSETKISVNDTYAAGGAEVSVDVVIENNPGILGMTLKLEYDDEFATLTSVVNGDALSAMTFTAPRSLQSGCNLQWDAEFVGEEDIKDGIIATLTFEISEEAPSNKGISVGLSYDNGAIIDNDLNPVGVSLVGGTIRVLDYTPGDLNDDGIINSTDVVFLRRYIAGYNISIKEAAGDVNDDGLLNSTDVVFIRRFIAGYDIQLKPSTPKCQHAMTETTANAGSCTEDGNIAYWYCSKCGKYFGDAAGKNEIAIEDTIIKAEGHVAVVDPAVEATYTTTGLTEGSHCAICKTVIVEQQVIPMLQKTEYSVTYHIANNDTYLASLNIENNNPSTYTAEDGLELQDLIVNGYNFKGWYTAQTGGTQVSEIAVGTTGNKVFYAQWEKVPYTVTFDSPLVPKASVTRTIDQTTPLDNLDWDGYIFMGWSDATGKIVETIKPGTTDITLYANWTSQRNQTRPNNYLEKGPVIIDDSENGKYYFVYDIGSIINVPLYTLKSFTNTTAGMTFTETYTKSGSVTSSEARTVNESISNATVKSSSWSLSKDWNELITESEDHTNTNSESYSVNISNSSSKAHTDSGNVSEGTSKEVASKEGTTSKTISKESANIDAEISGGVNAGVYKTEVKMSAGLSTEDTDESGESSEESESNGSTWNSEKSYSDSNSSSHSESVSNSIASSISDAWGYSISKSTGGSDSSTEATSSEEQETKGYSSSFSYNSVTAEETTSTWTNENAAAGYYRLVCAGTVHVFAVVGYDIATHSYYVYTYSVLDDETTEFTDYSKNDPKFEDYNNGVLPFEVPVSVNEYVSKALKSTNGLIIDRSTGIITDYEGTAKNVYIPDYMTLDNGDGTTTVVKVTGIDKNVFSGNEEITSVRLSKYITDIPDDAFNGCVSLKTVNYTSLQSIGDRAFKGCVALNKFIVDATVVSLGSDAFDGVDEVIVNAANASVVENAVVCGAASFTLNLDSVTGTLSNKTLVTDATEYLAINGSGKTYTNIAIESSATTTVINRMTFADNTTVPLKLNSQNVTLNQVTIANAPGVGIVLEAESTNISLQGVNNVTTSGDVAILSKSISLNRATGVTETTRLAVADGDVLVCGSVENDRYFSLTNSEIKYISEDEYTNMLNSHYVYFNANGGIVGTESKLVMWGSAFGDLPTPTRDYYTFDGWFTEAEDGTEVTAETIMNSTVDVTVYAHWTLNAVSGWVLASKVPEGAEVVDQKWTYTLTENTTSTSSSLSGWTQTSWEWKQTGSGTHYYASFPGGFSTGHSLYSKYNKSGLSAYENASTKRTVSGASFHTYIYYHWCRGNDSLNLNNNRSISEVYTSTYNTFDAFESTTNASYDSGAKAYKYNNSSCCGDSYWWNRFDVYKQTYVDYQKLYSFTKQTNHESATEVTETGSISNVQQWVQYRAK